MRRNVIMGFDGILTDFEALWMVFVVEFFNRQLRSIALKMGRDFFFRKEAGICSIAFFEI